LPNAINSGESFTIDYRVSDDGGSGLKQVELWRKDESSDWQEIKPPNTLSGENGPLSGSFTDSPTAPGKYWYGVHVVDNAGNWNDEKNSNTDSQPGSFGPIEVEIKSAQEPITLTPNQPITLTLYVRDGSASGPIIPGAQVTCQDGSGNNFEQTTDSNGYVTITGDPGTWSFKTSAEGYATNSWDQEIAETCTKHASLQEEQSAESWVQKGSDFFNQSQYDEALQAYEKAIELDPNLAMAWDGKGDALDFLGRNDEALQAHEKAIELDPNLAMAWNGKGNSLYMQNRYDEALQAYEKAIELDPNLAYAWCGKGTVLYMQRQYDEAIRFYDEAIRLEPEEGLYWSNKGDALKSSGRYNEADTAYAKAKELGFVKPGYKTLVNTNE